MTEWFTMKDISRRLDIPYSSVRSYTQKFPAYFVAQKLPAGRWPVYPDDAVEKIKLIRDSYQAEMKAYEIYNLLADKYGEVVDIAQPVSNASKLSVSSGSEVDVQQAIELINAGKAGYDLAVQTLDMYRQLLASQGELLSAQNDHIERLKARIADLEAQRGE